MCLCSDQLVVESMHGVQLRTALILTFTLFKYVHCNQCLYSMQALCDFANATAMIPLLKEIYCKLLPCFLFDNVLAY